MSKSRRRFAKKDKQKFELRALHVVVSIMVGLVLAGWIVYWQTGKDAARVSRMRQDATREISSQNAAQGDDAQPVPPTTLKLGGPFQLTDQDGKAVTEANFRGKYLLVYFGYTYCPDMCPTGLQSISTALDTLGSDAAKVQPLFITIDPARDTSAKLKEYIASFNPQIIGLTGSAQQIASVAKEYQVYYAKGEKVDDHDYIMEHSSLIYLMDPDGHFISTFPEDANPQALIKALQGAWAKASKP